MAETIANQFSGLDMHSLIAGPLLAACEAQSMLAASTARFIQDVGLEKTEDGKTSKVKTASFSFQRGVLGENGRSTGVETVNMQVPLLSIVKIPTLAIDDMNITFDMEVKSAESSESSSDKEGSLDANAKIGFGPFSAKVNIKGSIACHEKNTRSTDNSAKYHVSVHAKDFGTPEGLARMLDILATASTPLEITSNTGGGAISENGSGNGNSNGNSNSNGGTSNANGNRNAGAKGKDTEPGVTK